MGRELAVRIARRLGSGFVADAEGFEADGSGGIVWSKSVFGGETRLQCRCDGEVQIAAIRQNTFKKAAAGGADAGVEHISLRGGAGFCRRAPGRHNGRRGRDARP